MNKVTDYERPLYAFHAGICNGDPDLIRAAFEADPSVTHQLPMPQLTWLAEAVHQGRTDIARQLIELGCQLNITSRTPDKTTPLETAVREADPAMVKLFLEHGADPNFGKPMVSATNVRDAKAAYEIFRLLLEHGADVNRHYHWEHPEYAFTALDHARTDEIRQLLLSYGAKTSAQLYAEGESLQRSQQSIGETEHVPVDEVVAHFEKTVGPASKKSLIQIVPTGLPIGIHVIPPKGNRRHMTLFTNGLSAEPMQVPEGGEDYQYAELFIELPGDWKIKEVKDMHWAWPLYWLRKLAQYPHNADTWLGGPVTLIANEEPPQPLWPGSPFTALLLFAESSFQRSDGHTVQLYRVIPLYTSERQYELKHGLKRFMQALDKHEVPTIVDVNRLPFA